MHLVLSVPTNPNDTSKHAELSLQPGRANVTVGGKCPKNGTEEVKQGFFYASSYAYCLFRFLL